MNNRIDQLRASLRSAELNGLIVFSSANISYLTGNRSRDAYLLILPKRNIYLTDSRYYEEIKRSLKNFEVIKIEDSFIQTLKQILDKTGVKSIAFEASHLSYAAYQKISKRLARVRLIPASGLIEGLREIKDRKELALIRKAAKIALEAFDFIEGQLKPGKTELQIAAELERFIKYRGGYAASFEIIVGSGPNSSYPHHQTSSRVIRQNEPVLIDAGVDYKGYKSDLTRVFFLGKMKLLVREVFDIVKEAQAQAIKRIKAGEPLRNIDAAARGYIAEKGLGELFTHTTGHGVGLEVHEAPRVSAKETKNIKEGMVLTIEPGIYYPGFFGIRIEDMVVVTKKGAQVISGTIN